MSDRVYRDPVHGSIAFDWEKEKYIIELIDTPEFQRLRRIRQLGAAMMVFQGAEHSRLTHSIGVAHLAKRLFGRISSDLNFPKENNDVEEIRRAVIAGALLHDIGHGPFSHLFERVFSIRDHEKWGLEIISDGETRVSEVLKRHGLTDSVKRIFEKTFRPRFALDIISSQLDADRLDYLLRDSYMTGVAYGRYDLDWLIEVIELARIPTNGRDLGLTINRRKFHGAEQFVIGRYLMYQQVYFHKTIRSAERLIKLIFERLVDLFKNGDKPEFFPEPLSALVESGGSKLSVKGYLRLDDQFMATCFGQWQCEKSDEILADLCRRYVERDLFKTVLVDPTKIRDGLRYADAIQNLREEVQKAGFDGKYYLAADSAEDLPYRDMAWYVAKDKKPEDIWLSENGAATEPLSNPTVSPLIDSVRNIQVITQRICFPAEVKDLVKKYLAEYLTDRIETGAFPKPYQMAVVWPK
jgi:uncharacterized protein